MAFSSNSNYNNATSIPQEEVQKAMETLRRVEQLQQQHQQQQQQHQMQQQQQHQQQQPFYGGFQGPVGGPSFSAMGQPTQEQVQEMVRENAALKAKLESGLLPSKEVFEAPSLRVVEACKFWKKHGNCLNGNRCSYTHEGATGQAPRKTVRQGQGNNFDRPTGRAVAPNTAQGSRGSGSDFGSGSGSGYKRSRDGDGDTGKDNDNDRRLRKLEKHSQRDGESIKNLQDFQGNTKAWLTKAGYDKIQADCWQSTKDCAKLFKQTAALETSLGEHKDAPDTAREEVMKAFSGELGQVKENLHQWFVNTVATIHGKQEAKSQADFQSFGGEGSHRPMEFLAKDAVYFVGMVTTAMCPDPQVEMIVGEGEAKQLRCCYKGAPHKDEAFTDGKLLFRVFCDTEPFPVGGKTIIVDATPWCRTCTAPPSTSLRACLLSVRDLLYQCSHCKSEESDPNCKLCRYKSPPLNLDSPKFSPKLSSLPPGLPPPPWAGVGEKDKSKIS